jgi:hypothetical protein
VHTPKGSAYRVAALVRVRLAPCASPHDKVALHVGELRGDDPELASYLRIEGRGLGTHERSQGVEDAGVVFAHSA